MPAVRRIPLARPLIRAFYRLALLPLGRSRPKGRATESPDLVRRTDELNRAAERYFADYPDPEFILGKPFSDELFFPRYLFDLGVLFQGIRLRRRDVVVDLGAGTCWVSHLLNRYGCKTIAIDVSPTALEMGREVFRRDPATRWEIEPEFLVYDGHHIPLADGSCDKVVIHDAFHHIPNQRQILSELHRILQPDGIVGMCEPGRRHAATEASRREVAETGVLENAIVVEDLAALAEECGFAHTSLVLAGPGPPREVPARDLGPFMRGKGFPSYWQHFCQALDDGHYILLYKGDPQPTTRQPTTLDAEIRIRPRRTIRVGRGERARVRVRVRNIAETRWLAAAPADGGWTRLGVHLYRDGDPPQLVDFDWFRADLPRDLGPGEDLTLALELPALDTPATYRLVFDIVVENLTWLAERDSKTASVTLEVT